MMLLLKRKYCHFIKSKISVGLGIIVLALTGCTSDDISDLTQYIQGVKARPKGTIQPLPEIKVIEPFIFNPDGLRDPFRPVKRIEERESFDMSSFTGIHPDISRRKEELEAYSLDSLRMVGTVAMDKGLWALIIARDGTIHRVRKGHHIGLNYGEIIRVLDDRIELMEIVADTKGAWLERQASMALAE